jgi:hypothetical protein
MLLVRTYLDRSSIHGIGLFAAERIPSAAPGVRGRSPRRRWCEAGARSRSERKAPKAQAPELTCDYAVIDANHRSA